MQIVEHQLIDGATIVDLPHLPSPATVSVWRVPAEYRANGLFVAIKAAGAVQEVPACGHGAPEFFADLPAHAAALLEAESQALQADVVLHAQQRLDDFACTRAYDGILSACTYASSAVPKFTAEGQYCIGARDATWAKLYEILAGVKAGTRPAPAGYAAIEAELPPLAWPA